MHLSLRRYFWCRVLRSTCGPPSGKGIWVLTTSYWRFLCVDTERAAMWFVVQIGTLLRLKGDDTNRHATTRDKNQNCLGQTKTVTLVRGDNWKAFSHIEQISNAWRFAQNIFPLYQSFLTSIFHRSLWQKLFREKCRYRQILGEGFTWLLI